MDFNTPKPQRAPVWLDAKSGNFEEFRAIVSQTADPADTPLAAEVIRNIPIYQGADVDAAALNPAARQSLMAEWSFVFAQGAGIIVIRQGLNDHAVIDRASEIFTQIIADEKRAGRGGGIISPSRVRMTGSGIHWKSIVLRTLPTLPPISARMV